MYWQPSQHNGEEEETSDIGWVVLGVRIFHVANKHFCVYDKNKFEPKGHKI